MLHTRALKRLAGLCAVVALLTACGTVRPPGGPTSGNLEMFSWWTTGGQQAGLDALLALYQKDHPGVQVTNQAAAAGLDGLTVLKTRLLSQAPPDTFQAQMGHDLGDNYVATGLVAPLDDFYKSQGLTQVLPQGLLPFVSAHGHPYAVPVDINRANVLWYNKAVFSSHNLQPPQTFDDFFRVAAALRAKGVPALAFGNAVPFGAAHLFETVLLGTLGAAGYQGLWTGATSWNDPRITAALTTFLKMLGYANEDHAALTWQQADDYIVKGKAGMMIMTDWVDADFAAKHFTGYGWVPAPNTAGLYDVLGDTFTLPQGAKDASAATDWLKLVASRAGQDAFNPLAGSIPARTDAGQGAYDPYQQAALADWKRDTIVPSAVHGTAAKATWVDAYGEAINNFVGSSDVAAAQKALAQACLGSGVCHP